MDESRADVFDEQRPNISEADIETAARATRIVASWGVFPVVDADSNIVSLAIKFALLNGTSETVLLDRYGALVLRQLLETLDKAQWKGAQISPPGSKPN